MGSCKEKFKTTPWNYHFIIEQPQTLHFSCVDPGLAAGYERLWDDWKQPIMRAYQTGTGFENLPGSPTVDETLTPTIEALFTGYFSFHKSRKKPPKWFLSKCRNFAIIVKHYVDFAYTSGLESTSQVRELLERHRICNDPDKEWGLIEPLIQEIARDLVAAFSAKNRNKKQLYPEDALVRTLRLIARDQARSKSFLERIQELESLEMSSSQIKLFANQPNCQETYFYRPKNIALEIDSRDTLTDNVPADTAMDYLAARAAANPIAAELIKKINEQPELFNKSINLKIFCLGNFHHFDNLQKIIDEFQPNQAAPWLIGVIRLAGRLYEEEWQHLEGYKNIDAQLSFWEWKYNNPLLAPAKELPADLKKNFPNGKNVADIIIQEFSEFLLDAMYGIDKRNLNGISFSWPMFMEDIWNGSFNINDQQWDDFIKSQKKSITKKSRNQVFAAFKAELHRIVDDPNNLDTIFNLQPGFFKEFFLAKKMQAAGAGSLEELEQWLPHFTSRTHEGSKRNQITALVEKQRQKSKARIKTELMEAAMREYGYIDKWSQKGYVYMQRQNAGGQLAEYDQRIIINYVAPPRKDNDPSWRKCAESMEEYLQVQEFKKHIDDVYRRYEVLFREKYLEAGTAAAAQEEQIFLFSDQVVENQNSRLEIGPEYRLRFISQPLMDWHAAQLRQASGPEQAAQLYQRIETNIPEAHPLRDLFVQNQLNVEIWLALQEQLGVERTADLGITPEIIEINMAEALKKYPIHSDISFLKNYTLFQLNGLAEAFARLPIETGQEILLKIEDVLANRISADKKEEVRRLLFDLEAALRLPILKENQKSDPAVFYDYLAKIEQHYTEPTIARDHILESYAMELAGTPEQIRKVWNLMYAEQVRWPEEKESKQLKAQFEGFEKMRAFLEMMPIVDRAAYILWFVGGDEPLNEHFSVQETGISLQSRKQLFWKLTPRERRTLLYDVFMGEQGLLEGTYFLNFFFHNRDGEQEPPWKCWNKETDMVAYMADNIFHNMIGGARIDNSLPADHQTNVDGQEMLEIIFRELFIQQKTAARRAELMVNIIESMRQAKSQGVEITAGEMIRTLLEQIGVIGIKLGQLLSEQPGLLPEAIRAELDKLKDDTAPFSKRAVLLYLEAAGWVTADGGKIASIDERLGSASIKQVHRAKTSAGFDAAIKAKRPSIDKNFNADLLAAEKVIGKLDRKFSVPGYLLQEINKLVREELNFQHEAQNQMAMQASLESRGASLTIKFGEAEEKIPLLASVPLSMGDVHYPTPEITEDIGLIVEDYVKGFSLKALTEYQTALLKKDRFEIQIFRNRIEQMYDKSRITDIEKKVAALDISYLKAELGIEFIRQIVAGGAFHADLHEGNFYIDFTPSAKGGEVFPAKGIFIDIGSAGYSDYKSAPEYIQKQYQRDNKDYDFKDNFRDLLSALFSTSGKNREIAEIINRYGGVNWDESYVRNLTAGETQTGPKVKKIFYKILEESRGSLEPQFRLFLKAVATGAGHLDCLREALEPEVQNLLHGKAKANKLLPQLVRERLLNPALLI